MLDLTHACGEFVANRFLKLNWLAGSALIAAEQTGAGGKIMAGLVAAFLLVSALVLASDGSAAAAEPTSNAARASAHQSHKLVVQVGDNDLAKWNLS